MASYDDDDNDDSDEDEPPVPRQRMLRALMGDDMLGVDIGDAENVWDDMCNDLFADDNMLNAAIAGEAPDGEMNLQDDEEFAESMVPEEMLSFVRGRIDEQIALIDERRRVGFTLLATRFDIVKPRPRQPHAWIFDHDEAALAYSEHARVHEAVRNAVDYSRSNEPPQMGTGYVVDLPVTLADIKLAPWSLRFSPKLHKSNTVATCNIGRDPDQEKLATNVMAASLNANLFAAVVIRMPTGTILVFGPGTVVVAGPRGLLPSRILCLEHVNFLQHIDAQHTEFSQYMLQNIVCHGSAGFRVNLRLLSVKYVGARYEPDRFPGCILRMGNGKWVFIIFDTSNVIGTGFTSWEEACLAWRFLHSNVLWQFKDMTPDSHETAQQRKNRQASNDTLFNTVLARIARASTVRTVLKNMPRDPPKQTIDACEEFLAEIEISQAKKRARAQK